jgi:N-hydroxyarylamine O-acetyltransferase
MDLNAYLQRIGHHGTREPTADTLVQLHRAHMYSVPFENLDIPLGRPIVLSLPALFEKIVRRRRGGFCYELNALFGWCLRELGFEVEMLSARVFDRGAPGPEFDHMLLLVSGSQPWIADVGFGDSFVEPIPLGRAEQAQRGRSYRLVEQGEDWVLQQQAPGSDWEPQYAFSLLPRTLEDFHSMCHYQQTSPASHFTRKSVCSLATPGGRVTLSSGRLIVTREGHREERTVAGAAEYLALLREHFGIDLGHEPDPERLMQGR